MEGGLKILILGDEGSTVDLIDYELNKLSLRCTSLHVSSREAFLSALQEFSPDFVLVSAQNRFGSLTALALAQEVCPGVPFFCLDFSTHAGETVPKPVAPSSYPLPCLPCGGTPVADREVLQQFLETPGAVIAILSPEGRILEFNHGAERLTGYPKWEVLGQDGLEVFFPEAVWAKAAHLMQRVLSGESSEGVQLPIKMPHGKTRACRWYWNLLSDSHGQPAGIMMVGQYLAESDPWEKWPRAGLARAYSQLGLGRSCLTRRTGHC